MSPSSEKFTLLESGTSRLHFKLAKQLEDEGSTRRQDLVILETVAHIRKQLASRSIYSDVSNLTSALVTLLHCLQHYPRSATSLSGSATLIDTSFALLPTLQLLSLATSWKHLLIAHQLLPFLLPVNAPNNVTQDATSPFTRSSSRSSRGQIPTSDDSTSLLLLNTFRANLSAASDYPRPKALRHNTSSSARSRSRSSSNPRSLPESDSSSSINVRALASLKALVTGTLRGSAVLPSLATTLVDLTRHPDSSIRSMTMCAMLSCAEVSTTESTDSDGQTEILDAVLTIVRLTQASAYAFSVGSNLEENHGMILEEMEKRVDSSPKVLRTCIKIVNYARTVGLISAKEAACHAIEALQAARWAPMHLELTALQQRQVVTSVLDRTEGLRARKAARQRASLQVEHDYHGTYAPWLVQACLSSLVDSIESMNENVSQQLDGMTRRQLLKVVLRIYDIASRGRAAALLLCISAARCIAALYRAQTPLSGPAGDDDGELAILWNKLSAHIKSQLHNTNPNRKVAGIDLLSALLPLGWAQTTSEGEGQTSPLQITEAELGQLMVMLADADASVRKRALTLLHRVDPKLITLLRLQLQNAVKDAIDARKDEQGNYIRAQHDVPLAAEAQRLVEVAQFAISIQREPELQTACESEEAMSALEDSLVSAISLGLFGNFDGDRTASASAWTISTLISISCLSMAQRIHLLQRLMAHVVETNSTSESQERSYLCCRLLVDLRVHDLHEHGPAVNSFVQWVDSDLLSSHGLSTVLVKSSGDDRVAVAARETILGIAARMISLVVNIYGLQSSKHLSSGLAALQSTLSQLIETELVAAVRLEACNLLLVCETLLDPLCPGYEELIVKLKEIAISSHTLQDSTRSLLELQLEDSSPLRAGDTRGSSSIFSSRSLLATASQFFTPSSDPTLGASAPSDSFAAVRLRAQLPDSILHSSRLLSPEGSTDTLRSSKQPAPLKRSIVRKGRLDFAVDQLPSAIPPESKRLRDRNIAQAMSDSIANLVLGSEAKGRPLDNEVIFSVTSSGIMDSDIQELDLVHEVADPERRLDGIGAEGETPSLLDLVHQCHNHEPWLDTSLTPFVLDGVQIGFLQDRVVKACMDDSAEQIRAGSAAVLRKVRFSMDHREIMPPTCSSRICEAISFTSDFATPEARTVGLNAVAQRWRQARIFRDPLDGWRDELYAIYALNPRPGSRNPIAFKLERAACALFGFATFGVHLTAYSVAPGTGELKVWVPQRSLTKSTWPGYLDNSVAGGIVAGDLPMESMVRECEEEANLESSLVEKHIKQTGVLSYCYKTAKQGWIQPEVEYVYDLPLPPEVTLQPKDGEVDHFELLTLDEIYNKMSKGKFKPNCVLVMLDFLIRHGHITADTEPGYRQIVAQLHVDLRLPGP